MSAVFADFSEQRERADGWTVGPTEISVIIIIIIIIRFVGFGVDRTVIVSPEERVRGLSNVLTT